jgi:dihydroorotate dehydrogenase (NAD+) catalytic subunit
LRHKQYQQITKFCLTFSSPYMNAAGTLGFAPDYRAPVPWDSFGAFVTNPLSLRARKPTANPAVIEYPGGFLLHTGLPNPGLNAAIKKFARRWADSRLPVIVHLMADRPDETMRMVETLEGLENIAAIELGFAPLLSDDIILLTVEMSLGELPLIVSVPVEQVLSLGPRVIREGAAAIGLAAPRGMLPYPPASPRSRSTARGASQPMGGEHEGNERGAVTGRLSGPALFPQALLTVRDAVRASIPVIGAGGVGSKENADAMLSVGALAVQVDASLWKGDVTF